MKVTILGCGSSKGVPMIGNDWGDCDPLNPRNRRLRSSILVEDKGTVILVDTGPDLKEQLLRTNTKRLDAILYSHFHADHTHGIDDATQLAWINRQSVPIYADQKTVSELQSKFSYCFKPVTMRTGEKIPLFVPYEVHPQKPIKINHLKVIPFVQDHHTCTALGFRFGQFAYSTDVAKLDEEAFKALEGIDVWVVDCLREEPQPLHAHLDLTLEWIARVKPQKAYLTHMNQTLDYEALKAKLPAGVEPAYDGLEIITA